MANIFIVFPINQTYVFKVYDTAHLLRYRSGEAIRDALMVITGVNPHWLSFASTFKPHILIKTDSLTVSS